MVLSVPLSALPDSLLVALLEQGGPTLAAVAVLWWRINKLEERFSDRLDRIDEDVSSNSSLIYDRLLGQGRQSRSADPGSSSRSSKSDRRADPP